MLSMNYIKEEDDYYKQKIKELTEKDEYNIRRSQRQQKEIERLNNIINELEKWLEEDLKQVYRDAGHRHNLILEVLDKLQELKGSDSNE